MSGELIHFPVTPARKPDDPAHLDVLQQILGQPDFDHLCACAKAWGATPIEAAQAIIGDYLDKQRLFEGLR